MNNQYEIIKEFTNDANYIYVKFEVDEDYGKILSKEDSIKAYMTNNEIQRSIGYKNDDKLFVFDLIPSEEERYIDNPLQLIKRNLRDAKMIENVYPNIFRWVFNGISIRAQAIVPSGNPIEHSTISRYGGTAQFMRILQQHLENIVNMSRGKTPDYNFLNSNRKIDQEEISIGSINMKNKLFCVGIDLNLSYLNIMRNSMQNIQTLKPLNKLRMKYWAREINPDFIVEAKHIKLSNPLDLKFEEAYALYPQAIKNIMALKDKGNFNRHLLVRFLLAVHKPVDAKFIYYSILSPEELDHVKYGNCSTQWNYILNNQERYGCPTFKELRGFADPRDNKLTHPLELVEKYMESKNAKEKDA